MPYVLAFVVGGSISAAVCASLLALAPPRFGATGLFVAASLLLVALAGTFWPQVKGDDRPITPVLLPLLLVAWTLGPAFGIQRARTRSLDGRRYGREVASGMVGWFLANLLVVGLCLALLFFIPSFRSR